MKKTTTLLITLIISIAGLSAQVLKAHTKTVEGSYNFWTYTPDGYDTCSTPKPLIVFLHGRSLCGNDLKRVRRYGPLNAIERGLMLDAVVLAPQNPGGAWKPSKVMKLVEWTTENLNIDTNRIYVIGMSLGGYGTIDFAGNYPHRIAAAMALCGGGTLKDFCGLNEMPLWILHGTADRAVGVKASQRVVDAIHSCGDGSRLLWSPLKGMNHGQLARVFYLPETYEWLLSHSLADSNRAVNPNFEITTLRLNSNIYRSLQKTKRHVHVK